MSEYDGKQFVGIDLHRQRSVIVRQTSTGEQLAAVRIVNDPVALGLQIEKAGPNPEVVLEATYGWYWAVDTLEAAGATVHLAHPLGVKGFRYRRVKNTSPSRAPSWCGGRRSRPSGAIRQRRRSPPTKIASRPAAARASPRSPRPANCSRSSTTGSAMDISAHWPGIGRREHLGRNTCVAAVCHDLRTTAWSPA
jgi:hypothetical protein